MKIKLSEIKEGTPRVRKELNLDKLDELADSIKEMDGVIVPIKVRKNGDGYTCIYGHRRIKATRMAGFDEIDAFVEGVDDAEAQIQALIENVVREDMAPLDIAKALQQIKLEHEWTNEQVGSRFGMDERTVRGYLDMLKPAFVDTLSKSEPGSTLGYKHLIEAKAGTDDDADAVKVLEKSAKEGLSRSQTRTVAEEYKRIKTGYGAREAKKVLTTPFSELGLKKHVPKSRPDSRTRTPVDLPKQKEVRFSWIRDINIIRAGDIIQAQGAGLAELNVIAEFISVNLTKEPKLLKVVIAKMIDHLQTRIKDIEKLIDRLSEYQVAVSANIKEKK